MIIQGCFPSGACFPRCAMINMLTSFTKVFGRYIYLGSFITSLLVQNSRLILVTSQFFSAFDYFQDSSPTSVDVYRLVTSSLKITDCVCLVPATNNSASAALITHVGKQQTSCIIEKETTVKLRPWCYKCWNVCLLEVKVTNKCWQNGYLSHNIYFFMMKISVSCGFCVIDICHWGPG